MSTHPEIVARMAEIHSEVEKLSKYDSLTRSQTLKFDALREEFYELDTERKDLERSVDREKIRQAARSGSTDVGLGLAGSQFAARADSDRDGGRDGAMRLVEGEVRSGRLPDEAAERVEKLVSHGTRESTSYASRWALATGSSAYRGAFAKLAMDPERGHLMWTPEEADAFRTVRELQTETRAMSLTDTAGGFMVPMHLDPAIILTSAGSSDPMRRIARVEQIATDVWNGVSSAGATAEWKAENAQAADASPTLAQPSIPVHFGDAFVPYSIEVGMDGGDAFLRNLAEVLADAAQQLQTAAYWRGTGVGQPKGLITALLAAGGATVATTAADTLAMADVIKPQNALSPRFQANASWAANLQTINAIGQFETAAGARRYPTVDEGRLLNRNLYEASQLDNPGATAAAGNDEVMVYGDFKHFVIVDRIGSTLEFIPHTFGANGRPLGQRGAFLWFRTGSDITTANAFKILQA